MPLAAIRSHIREPVPERSLVRGRSTAARLLELQA